MFACKYDSHSLNVIENWNWFPLKGIFINPVYEIEE